MALFRPSDVLESLSACGCIGSPRLQRGSEQEPRTSRLRSSGRSSELLSLIGSTNARLRHCRTRCAGTLSFPCGTAILS